MKDVWFGEPIVHQSGETLRAEAVALAAAPECAPPQSPHEESEGRQSGAIGGHGVILEIAPYHLPQPPTDHRDGLMHPLPQLRFQFPQFGPHPVAPRLPHQQEIPLPGASADVRESQKVERFRFVQSASGSPSRIMAAEFEQARLLWMQLQAKLFHPLPECFQKAAGFPFVLETDNDVVGIAHQDDFPSGVLAAPAVRPEVEHVVQVDIGQYRRDDRVLRRTLLAGNDPARFQDAGFQPQLDQPQQSPIRDPVFQESQ
jgi:hypothetical protein